MADLVYSIFLSKSTQIDQILFPQAHFLRLTCALFRFNAWQLTFNPIYVRSASQWNERFFNGCIFLNPFEKYSVLIGKECFLVRKKSCSDNMSLESGLFSVGTSLVK
jgi:hypothetical protein